jgi:hypothetical protein
MARGHAFWRVKKPIIHSALELSSNELEKTTVVSVGHRPALEAFRNRKIILEYRHRGAKLVSDVYSSQSPAGCSIACFGDGLRQPQSRDNRRDEAKPRAIGDLTHV